MMSRMLKRCVSICLLLVIFGLITGCGGGPAQSQNGGAMGGDAPVPVSAPADMLDLTDDIAKSLVIDYYSVSLSEVASVTVTSIDYCDTLSAAAKAKGATAAAVVHYDAEGKDSVGRQFTHTNKALTLAYQYETWNIYLMPEQGLCP